MPFTTRVCPQAVRACVSGCECFHNGTVCEPSVLEVKGTEKEIEKFCWFGASPALERGRKKGRKKIHCFLSSLFCKLFEVSRILFCYANRKNEKNKQFN